MNAHVMIAAARFPQPALTFSTPWADAAHALACARLELLRVQARLQLARRFRATGPSRFWENRVLTAIDAVYEAQENFKAAKRFFHR